MGKLTAVSSVSLKTEDGSAIPVAVKCIPRGSKYIH